MKRIPLPIDAVLADVCAALDEGGTAVLTAPPGSGKTTRVPGALVDHGLDGEVWVLQPRRLAARAAARRVAAERGVPLGEEVGFQVRHEKRVGPKTRIRFVTEGILARTLVADPFLPGVGAVVLDEFHERSLEADLALAMLQEVRTTVREDLRVLVMSATMDPGPIQEFLAPCPWIDAPGRRFDVAIEHLGDRGELPDLVRAGVEAAVAATGGDVLVFLPGVGEIQACLRALGGISRAQDLDLRPLHGQLPAAEQDAAIQPGDRRKVVLATNVAETSITIPGVTAVVDSGWARVLRHDPGRGLDRLEKVRVSRASADQRAGRAGRTAPGICFRLWSLAEERGLLAYELPEIRRLDLSGAALQVWAFAARDPGAFGWFEPPEPSALQRADSLLRLLGAVADAGLTSLGREMLRYPLHPRLARMMHEGGRRGCVESAAEIAALLAERELVGRRREGRPADLFALRELLHEAEAAGFDAGVCRRLGIDSRAARAVAQARGQIARSAPRSKARAGGREDDEDLIRTLVAGYPDRVSRRTDEQSLDAVMASGRGCRLTMRDHENLGLLFLSLQVREAPDRTQSRSLVDLACPLREEWLEEVFPGAVQDVEAAVLHGERRTATAVRRRMFGRLVLEERIGGRPDPELARALFDEELRRDPWRILGEQKALRGFLGRVAWLRATWPEAELPELGDGEVVEAALAAAPQCTRLADLARAKILEVLEHTLPPAALHLLRQHAPERIRLPSGRQASIDYVSGETPFVAARLQEFFGLAATPRLAGGRVPLLLHLLGPNHRPVQITSDLQSFWANTYPEVRRELKRRYPRHSWPEDPLTSVAEARPPRRRRPS